MPMFEYECGKCGHVTTYLEKAGNGSSRRCEKCGSADVKKLVSGFGVKSGSGAVGSCPTGTCPFARG